MTNTNNATYIAAVQELMRCPIIYDHMGDMMYLTRLYNRHARYGDLTRFNDAERARVDALVQAHLAKEKGQHGGLA